MSTETLERAETATGTGSPKYAHLVGPEGDKDGAVRVMEARINGTPVKALCGHTWIPSRDPNNYPVCPPCKEVFESETEPEGEWKVT